MRKLIIAFVMATLPALTLAAGGAHLEKANADVSDIESLQRGAKLFVNYCLSCHSAQYMRYNRLGKDLGLTDDQVKENLMFTTDKIGDTMKISMPQADATTWFGNPPPDLSVIARARGEDYIYTYLKTFYVDDKKPMGTNNVAFPDVGMPNVLWELEGLKAAIKDDHGNVTGFEKVQSGSLSDEEFDQVAHDLTNFLVYLGEPIQLERKRLGFWVLLFLAIFFVFAYALKKEYWKDVH